MKKTLALTTTLAALSLSLAQTPAFSESRAPVFACEGNFEIILHGRSAQTATLRDQNTNRETPMAQVVSGSGMRFVGGPFEFTAKGDDGMLFGAQNRGLNCQIRANFGTSNNQDNTLNPLGYGKSTRTNQGYDLNIAALSYGGKIRRGPSVNHSQVSSIRSKQSITVLRNTGVAMDGYDWFEIRTRNGLTGFHWGGLMCTPGRPSAGMLRECPRF